MVFGPSGRGHDSQNQLIVILETPRYFKKSKKNVKPFKNILLLEVRKSKNLKLLKKGVPRILKTWNLESGILKCWNFEAWQLGNLETFEL